MAAAPTETPAPVFGFAAAVCVLCDLVLFSLMTCAKGTELTD